MSDAGARRATALVGLAGVVCVVVMTWVGTLPPGFSAAARSPLDATLILLTALIALGVGLIDVLRDPAGWRGVALLLAGLAWPLAAGANPGSGSPVIFTLALVLPYACAPLMTHVAMASLGAGTSTRVAKALAAAVWLGAVVVAGIVPVMLFQPALEGCRNCPQNLIGIVSAPELARDVRAIGLILTAASCSVTVIWFLATLGRATRAARTAAIPSVAPAAVVLAIVAVNALVALPRREPWPQEALWRACAIALLATAMGVVAGWWRIALTRQRTARLAVEVADSPRPGGLRELLAQQLDDPGLTIAYAVGDGRLVGADGRATSLIGGPDRLIARLMRNGRTVALLEHRRTAADDPAHLDAIVRASRLALENERLQAASRARLEDLRASRAQVVEAGDSARIRLERDLHDGAQQRLVSLALALRLCRARLGPDDVAGREALDSAERELRRAIEQLRGVAHGLYPAVLADEGLAAGVDALREMSAIPMTVTAMPDGRFSRQVEAAAWFAIQEAGRDLRRGRLSVKVQRIDDGLQVDVLRDGSPMPELTDVEDRIGALDGTVRIVDGTGSTSELHAMIPCAS